MWRVQAHAADACDMRGQVCCCRLHTIERLSVRGLAKAAARLLLQLQVPLSEGGWLELVLRLLLLLGCGGAGFVWLFSAGLVLLYHLLLV